MAALERWCAAALLLLPLLARAHGMSDSEAEALQRATGGEWMPYASAGFTHMLAGWDHLMFVAVLLLGSRRWADAAWGITAFSIGHSITLYVSFAIAWHASLAAVDAAVALSIAALAALALLRLSRVSPVPSVSDHRWLLPLVLGAGLVHGLGLAGALHLKLDDLEPTLGQIVAFNVGVEGAQMLVLALLTLAGAALLRSGPTLRARLGRPTPVAASLSLEAASLRPDTTAGLDSRTLRKSLLLLACGLALGLTGWHVADQVRPQTPTASLTSVPWRSETLEFQLPPGGIATGELEWAVRMAAGDVIVYAWEANAPDGRFWSDFHGVAHGTEQTQTYRRRLGASAAGSLRAPFDGQHGWYWQNQTREPVTIRLRVSGFYAPAEPAASTP